MDQEEEILADPEEGIDYLTKAGDLLSSYGWLIFAALLCVGYFWKRIQTYFDKFYSKYEQRRYDEKYHKNPDLALERFEGVQRARERMQAELDRKAKEYEEKRKEREAMKVQEKVSKLEGNRLGGSSSTAKEDFFPLMGDTSRGYRAPKKKGCSGGGCG